MGEPELASLLHEHASRHSVPGAAIRVLRDGVAVTASMGVADMTTGEPVTSETRFAVGSLCKPMVATAIARVAGAGCLSLDDPVAAHVPELRGAEWAARASVHDLLANRSRLPLRAPAGSTLLSTATDLLRLAGSQLEDSSLAALRGSCQEVRIHGWLDAWCLGWARFDWDGGPVWGWDGLTSGHRAVLRLVPEQNGAAVLLTNCGTGRALYRSIFPDIMEAWFGVHLPPLRLEPSGGAAGDLSRFAGVYAWPDLLWEVTATDTSLIFERGDRTVEGLPVDERTFLVDAGDPDTPTVTFAGFDDDGRPGVLYDMIWGLTRA